MSDRPKTKKRKKRKPHPENAPRNVSYRGNPNYTGKRRRGKSRMKRIREWMQAHRAWATVARLGLGACVLLGLVLVYFASQLPDIRALDTIKKQQGITIESADGHIIANYGDVYGTYVPYDQIPKSLVYAVIATEDRRFFSHHGVDFFGIARAMVTNIMHRRLVQGGSTVTQQVAKNVFLTPERSIKRKLQEVLLAFWLEARFSKKEIMAIYLNRVYLGGGAFGIDAASHRYFNKSAHDLNLYESASLAGLLKAPSRYSPAANSDRAKARVHQVLLNMVDAGYLKEKDVMPTINNYEKSPSHQAEGGDVRYFTDWVVDTLPDVVGQSDEDLIVTATIDTKLQNEAQDALQNIVSTDGAKKNVSQGAIIAMKPDGAVQALIGGLNYAQSQYNRAVQAKRQPGSSFKLFVYLAGLEAGLTPQSIVDDSPFSMQVGNKVWAPSNFESEGFAGPIPLVEALRYSRNIPSIKIGQYAGFNKVSAMAERLGIPGIPSHPSIALGAVEATLLEMTGAYAHLANGGNSVEPYGILKVRTREGKEIYNRETADIKSNPVLAKGTVEMMNFMLLDVVARGTGSKASLPGRRVAGKTGTSQDYRDAWFIGFTPQLVTGVWVGNDDNKSMKHVAGGSIPATVFHDFMVKAMEGKPALTIPSSEGSSEGLLPWLFGGQNVPNDGSTAEGADNTPREAIPADSPFGVENHGNAPVPVRPNMNGAGLNGATSLGIVPNGAAAAPAGAAIPNALQAPANPGALQAHQPPGEPPAPAPAEQPAHDPAALSPEFWNKLMDKVPENSEKGKVEHTYPGANKRR